MDIRGRPCIVIGGGEVGQRKVERLLKAGAQVALVSPEATEGLREQARHGRIRWIQRVYRDGDLEGVQVAIAATNDESVNGAIAREAEEGKVLINVVDDPVLCTFIAPAIVERDKLTIAVSTFGESPALARRIREELELLFPAEYATLLEVVSDVRATLQQGGQRAPADLWQRALSNGVLDRIRAGGIEDAREGLLETLRSGSSSQT